MRFIRLLNVTLLSGTFALAQEAAPPAPPTQAVPELQERTPSEGKAVLPAGTKILLMLKNSVSSRNARPGDGVYLETSFPVVHEGRVVVPAGTFVQGVVDSVKRAGRIKGRAEILIHFTTMIYPNGYTVSLPGSVESADSADTQKVKDKEGTVQAEGQKGRDAAIMVATGSATAGAGAMIGGLSTRTAKGVGVGSGVGAAVGVLSVLLMRGDDVRLENGSAVEMILNRPVELELDRIDPTNRMPQQTIRRTNRMEKQVLTPAPTTVNGIPVPR